MEWLKAILEKAKIEDGKLDIDGVMSTVNSEFPKYAVPKNVFNDKVTELKTANKTIDDLKQSNADNGELQKKITEYEGEIETLKTNALNTAKTFALKEQLAKAGVTDADYLIYKQGGSLHSTKTASLSVWTIFLNRLGRIRRTHTFLPKKEEHIHQKAEVEVQT